MQQLIFTNKRIFALLLVLLFFTVFLFAGKPLFNSGDDVYLMYTLAGGFGEAPTNLLHTNHIWHPLLGWMIKSLFILNPHINWYTLFLLALHFLSCTLIVYLLLVRIKNINGLVYSVLFFFVFESMFLLRLDFGSTSMLTAVAACAGLYHVYKYSSTKNLKRVLLFALLSIAALLRLHMAALAVVLFLPLYPVSFLKKDLLKLSLSLLILAVVIFIFNKAQTTYYEHKIPGWKNEEAFRQAFYYMANRPSNSHLNNGIFKDTIEKAFWSRSFYYDTNYINTQRLDRISKEVVRVRTMDSDDIAILKELFMEARLYILLLLVICILIFLESRREFIRKALPVIAWSFLIYTYLFIFQKITLDMFIGAFMILFLQCSLLLSPTAFTKRIQLPFFLVSLIMLLWAVKRIRFQNDTNRENNKAFICAAKEMNEHRVNIFLATEDNLPLDYFYIWEVPAQYPLYNLIYSERMMTRTYQFTLKRFGIKDLVQELPYRSDILLTGRPMPELNDYYKTLYHINTSTIRSSQFNCLEVYRLIMKP